MIPIEHLAPYLPYSLQFYGASDVWTMTALSDDGSIVLYNGLHKGIVNLDQVGLEYKPILLPITGVFINGSDYEKGYKKEVPRMWGAAWSDSALHSFQKANYFFKNKFDVFGLIAEGLAEDATILNITVHRT